MTVNKEKKDISKCDNPDYLTREQLHEQYEKTMYRKALYPRGGKYWETRDFQKWYSVRYKDQDDLIDSNEIANEIIKKYDILTPKELKHTIYIYGKGLWSEEKREFLDNIILEYFIKNGVNLELTDSQQNSKISMIRRYIYKKTYCSVKDFNTNDYLINVKNGVIDITDLGKLTLRKHDPKDKITRQLPINYDPEAKCHEIDKFLSEIFNSGDLKLIHQISGLCLTPIMKYQKAFMFYGKGTNGKTIFFNLLVSLIGKENTSKVDLIELDQKFEFANIENKYINLCSEADTKNEINIKRFKEYVGNELYIIIRKLFQNPYQIKPTAKLLYAVNDDFPNIPKNVDKGFFRKWIIIQCPNEFDEKKNTNLLDTLTTPEELSGLLNIALKGLIELLKNNVFDKEGIAFIDWEDVKNFWLKKINPFSLFLEEKCEKGDYEDANKDPNNTFWHIKDDVYHVYNTWRKDKGKTPISSGKALTNLIKQNGFKTDKRRYGKPVYIGFRIKDFERETKQDKNQTTIAESIEKETEIIEEI